ncbi:MAG: hypothetical protein QXJ74_08170 [Nitrososphaera sp.]|uniref:hypothetical protein n=1 Tax=Nitrososphaera sp. TaxID=1971748 RepID=UPI001834BA60|nr:hypothetical protein [Nitrososphaera sp.]NWG36156.1 hypothetical protein [Nitrososphaera sp.]
MSEFLTAYPRTSISQGLRAFIQREEIELDHLSLMVKTKKDEIIQALLSEGFKTVRLENKKPNQIGCGLAKRLAKPWEMHVRLFDMQQGLIAIQAEVEISRKYIQHIRSVRAPVIYELEQILKKHQIEYKIWNAKVRDYITRVIDNHEIKLVAPSLPAISWKHMAGYVSALSLVYLAKFLGLF